MFQENTLNGTGGTEERVLCPQSNFLKITVQLCPENGVSVAAIGQ
jgi:hypothetical protein